MTKRAATKTVAKTTASTVPSLEQVLSTMAYHIADLTTARGHFNAGIGGFTPDAPFVMFECEITECKSTADSWGVAANCAIKGGSVRGSRVGARNAIVAAYAPVIAWVAAWHAAHAETIVERAG